MSKDGIGKLHHTVLKNVARGVDLLCPKFQVEHLPLNQMLLTVLISNLYSFNVYLLCFTLDDDVDLFASDEEDDAEAERIRAERVQAYADKKSKKPALIAKSSIIMEVKPWDDETGIIDIN